MRICSRRLHDSALRLPHLRACGPDDAHTLQLVRSLFGEVPHVERVSDWLFRSAAGSPKLTLELAEHLLARPPDRDTRLEAGWHLVHTDDEPRGAAILG